MQAARSVVACVYWVLAATSAMAAETDEASWVGIAVPLVAYDTNLGVGGGAYGQIVVADPTGARPYRASVDAQTYLTTTGFQDHYVGWDLPGAFGSTLRWDMRLRYQSWSQAPYYGQGNHTPRSEPADVPERWNLWQSKRPFAMTHLRIPIAQSPVEIYVGGLFSSVSVTAAPNSLLNTTQPTGIDGGTVSALTVGLFRDTRTDEIDPEDGTAIDIATRATLPAPLSDYHFVGGHTSFRGWWAPIDWMVLAGHAMVDARTTGEPFYDQAYFGGLQRTGIGGRYLLRGLAEERLRGDGVVAAQAETRFRLGSFRALKKFTLGWTLAAFSDIGRVWTWSPEVPHRQSPYVTTGSGLRINLNSLLIVRADVAVGWEHYAASPEHRPQVQLYMLAAQPF